MAPRTNAKAPVVINPLFGLLVIINISLRLIVVCMLIGDRFQDRHGSAKSLGPGYRAELP